MDHLEEMDKFLEKHNLLKLKQKKQNMNKPITDTKIESVKENKQTKNLPTNNSPGLDGFPGEFYQKLREELIPIPLKLFQKTAMKRKFPNSFYVATITLIPKPDKNVTERKITGQYH